ncbi:MAG: hypothetical protein AAGJ55_05200 [Cyanobacteria bacterium J06555_12]
MSRKIEFQPQKTKWVAIDRNRCSRVMEIEPSFYVGEECKYFGVDRGGNG